MGVLSGCKKDNDWTAAEVKDIHIEPAAITAYVTASFDYAEKHELFFEYSDYDDMMYAHRYPMVEDGDGKYHTTVYNLEGLTTYYYRFSARSKHGTKETAISKFTTVELLTPTLQTKAVSAITVFSGTTGGIITFDGGAPVKKCGVCWSLHPDPTLNDSVVFCEQVSDNFTSIVSGLTPETTCYVRAFATNKAGTAYGQVEHFTTGRITLPMVTTGTITNINRTWATCRGEVLDEGGLMVFERGICWSDHPDPTLDDSSGKTGTGLGTYLVVVNHLTPNTTYYVRAYAINGEGLTYGEVKEFTTLPTPETPEGGLDGAFSVANRKQVWFSQGNLQYHPVNNVWRFAEEQYDYIGKENDSISDHWDGWIDLFGWGTSGWPGSGVSCYQPFSKSTRPNDYLAGGILDAGLFNENENADWGYYNCITNGGNLPHEWYTLTKDEWNYLLGVRFTLSGVRYAKAIIDTIPGLLIPSDDWNSETFNLNAPNQAYAPFESNTLSLDDWEVLEANNVVFLPAAGHRRGKVSSEIKTSGNYWTSSGYEYSVSDAYDLFFTGYQMNAKHNTSVPYGNSVRVVKAIP